jgi:hypothetical protein
MPQPDADGFTKAKGRRQKKAPDLIKCTKASCTGRCPRTVVEQGLRGVGFVPAKCLICSRPYKLVAGSGTPPTAGKRQQTSEAHRLQQLQAENKSLKQQLQASATTAAAAAAAAADPALASRDDGATPNPHKAAAKALQKKIQQLKDFEPEFREELCEGKGGYAAFLAQLEGELQQAWARQRVQLPLAQQKASAEAHLKRKQKAHDDAASELQNLVDQQKELEREIVEQQVVLAEAESLLRQAKLDAVSIAERATAELRGDGIAHDHRQSSIVTATTVKDFFQQLPHEVAGHQEGQQTIQQVMLLLDKLDSAAKIVVQQQGILAATEAAVPAASSDELTGIQVQTPAAAPPIEEDMQIDEDMLSQLAEAAVPPAGESEGDEVARQTRVDETRDRLRSKRTDLARGLARVRKIPKK